MTSPVVISLGSGFQRGNCTTNRVERVEKTDEDDDDDDEYDHNGAGHTSHGYGHII